MVDLGKAEGVADQLVDANDEWLTDMPDAGKPATAAARELVVEADRARGSIQGKGEPGTQTSGLF